MNTILTVLLTLSTTLLQLTCKKPTEPPTYVRTIELGAEETSSTETWLRIRFTDGSSPRSFQLKRDGQVVQIAQGSPLDTVAVDTMLAPRRTYSYKAYRLSNGQPVDSSALVSATTMDSTSHDFQWQTFVLGDGNDSGLNDVVIVNDTLVYACGNINIQDSVGQWQPPYGLAIWNGAQWQLQRLYAKGPTGVVSNLRPRGVFSFSATDVWFASGGVFHWDGIRDTTTPHWINSFPGNPNPILLAGQSAEKLWGTSGQYLFVVGNQGAIAFYSGSAWQRIESGVAKGTMVDVWGYTNAGNTIVFSVGGTSGNVKLLSLSPLAAHDTLAWPSTQTLGGIWTQNRFQVYVAGAGIWRYRGSSWRRMEGMPLGAALVKVRGSSENNVFTIGGSFENFALLMHFNGVSWHEYAQLPTDFRYRAIAVTENMIVAVGLTVSGTSADKACAVIGRRSQ